MKQLNLTIFFILLFNIFIIPRSKADGEGESTVPLGFIEGNGGSPLRDFFINDLGPILVQQVDRINFNQDLNHLLNESTVIVSNESLILPGKIILIQNEWENACHVKNTQYLARDAWKSIFSSLEMSDSQMRPLLLELIGPENEIKVRASHLAAIACSKYLNREFECYSHFFQQNANFNLRQATSGCQNFHCYESALVNLDQEYGFKRFVSKIASSCLADVPISHAQVWDCYLRVVNEFTIRSLDQILERSKNSEFPAEIFRQNIFELLQ